MKKLYVRIALLDRLNKQMVSFQGGICDWLVAADSGPDGLGMRFAMTLLFPK